MEKKRLNRVILWTTAAALVFGAVLCFLYFGKPDRYDVVVFGDSRIVGDHLEVTVPEYIERETGLTALNAGFGGSMITEVGNDAYRSKEQSFSMVALSKMALNGDFKLLSAVGRSDSVFYQGRPHYKENAKALSRTDLKKARYIVIGQGINDAMYGFMPDDDEKDPKNVHTYGGALRTSIENLRKAAPKAEFILIIPAYYDESALSETDSGDRPEAGRADRYADVIRKVAKEYDIPVADLYEGTGINADNYREYLLDGLHFNDKGAMISAGIISDIIKQAEETR